MKQLLFSITRKDLVITYFSGHGGGGQHRNKHKNCVRIQHPPSGAMASNCTEKSLPRNKKMAFEKLCANKVMKDWIHLQASKSSQEYDDMIKRVDAYVDEAMNPKNIKVEYL